MPRLMRARTFSACTRPRGVGKARTYCRTELSLRLLSRPGILLSCGLQCLVASRCIICCPLLARACMSSRYSGAAFRWTWTLTVLCKSTGVRVGSKPRRVDWQVTTPAVKGEFQASYTTKSACLQSIFKMADPLEWEDWNGAREAPGPGRCSVPK